MAEYKETGIFDENEICPCKLKGIGQDILPKNMAFDIIDQFIKVTDKDSVLLTRRLDKEEGCGLAPRLGHLWGARIRPEYLTEADAMVIVLPEHGTRYLAKIHNGDGMRAQGWP